MMLVMILERTTPSLRGHISRWLIEPKAGVFVGSVTPIVRDKLWEKCKKESIKGAVVQIWDDNSEQGYSIRIEGVRTRKVVDNEGVFLIKILKERNALNYG